MSDEDVIELAKARRRQGREGGPLLAYSEIGLAQQFAVEHPTLRYVAATNKWLHWTGTHWARDEKLRTFDLARALCEKAARASPVNGKSLASSRTVAAVVTLARYDRQHATALEEWDRHPFLLATPGGTVCLKTGAMRPAVPEDYLTRSTSVAPANSDCPKWREFLKRVTDDDIQLQEFLQRVCGYGLTGSVRDHAMFFLFGLGANGKSVFLNTVAHILDEYHRSAPMEMLLVTRNERHPTELAGLAGRRVVTATEVDQGRRWAEAKIRALTGGDKVSARFMRGDFFEFEPEFKLLLAGNHKPSLNTVNEAMRRRLYLVPFTVTIPVDKRDPDLAEKLAKEAPGILQWMVDGCLEWQEHGLAAPKVVTDATGQYLASQDTVRNWLDECTTEDAGAEHALADLFASWRSWCQENNEFTGSSRTLGQRLRELGLPERHTKRGPTFQGRKLPF